MVGRAHDVADELVVDGPEAVGDARDGRGDEIERLGPRIHRQDARRILDEMRQHFDEREHGIVRLRISSIVDARGRTCGLIVPQQAWICAPRLRSWCGALTMP